MAAVRKDKLERDRRLLAKHRAHFDSVLDKLGVRQTFDRLPLPFRNKLYVLRVRPATVELDRELAHVDRAQRLRQDLQNLLADPILPVPGRPEAPHLSFRDVYGPLFTLYARLGPVARPTGAFADAARAFGWACTNAYLDFTVEFDRRLYMHFMWDAQFHSRLDERIFVASLERRGGLGACGERYVRVSSEPRRRRDFHDHGRSRPASQVAAGIPGCGIHWLEWDPATLGLPAGPYLPVYVQSHAIRRLMERLPGDRSDGNNAVATHMLITAALFNPTIAQRVDDTWWVALRGYRNELLGYLLADVVDGAVLVRTFKFLTMAGSPEAKRLYRRLGARRADFEHLGLDRLSTFVETDLQADPEMRAIFEECGCGHLFDLRKQWEWPDPGTTRTAAWIKSYLEIDKKRARAA